ncbi:unknown [Firmicutes bacterium CAG:884]|nr:unknown [Firmicutes bacterium CAG:884]
MQMVKRMIEEKISYETISKVTELSLDEIKEIEKGINQEKS